MKRVRLFIAAAALAVAGLVASPAYACPNCDKAKCGCAKKGEKGEKCEKCDKCAGKKSEAKSNKK